MAASLLEEQGEQGELVMHLAMGRREEMVAVVEMAAMVSRQEERVVAEGGVESEAGERGQLEGPADLVETDVR